MSRETDILHDKNPLFPVFLKLEGLQVLLVGAGKVGLEKLNAVLQNAPATPLTVVSREICAEIAGLAQRHHNIRLFEKEFEVKDLAFKQLVLIAVNDRAQSSLIRSEAKKRGLLVNVADTPELCDFYLGSIVQKGPVKLAISTNGKSPTLAKRLKEVLQEAIPDAIGDLVGNLHLIRSRLKGDFSEKVAKLNALTGDLLKKENGTTPR